MLVATHSGPFHTDDVFALALLRVFADAELKVVRTRDLARIADADIAVDVGGEFDPSRCRFDHHQRDYRGERSSAGMVLDWLEASARVAGPLAARLRRDWVDHIDAVDCGRVTPHAGIPTLGAVVSAICELADGPEAFDARFDQAVEVCEAALRGILAAEAKTEAARQAVAQAMEQAEARGERVLRLDRHYKWKRVYFELGGAKHPTDYVLFPERDSVRLLAIPPEPDSFAQKRPLPEAWAGLVDAALSAVVGVPDARFCHRNRFIAVFGDVASAEGAIERWGLASRPDAEATD